MGTGSRAGVLTPNQRDYLSGEYDPTDEGHMRRDIRQSIIQTFDDLGTVAKHLSDRDMGHVRGHLEDPDNRHSDRYQPAGYLAGAIQGAISLLFRCRANPEEFAEYVERGVKAALRREGYDGRVRVSLDVHGAAHTSGIASRFEDRGVEGVTLEELGTLHGRGEISLSEYIELVREKADELERFRDRVENPDAGNE